MKSKSISKSALASSWALLLGFGILMLGDGLQGTLLAVRADLEGFSASLTGIIMSSFYIGFLAGSFMTPKIVASVGHIRVFAALAALASAAILIHAVFVQIPAWIVLRLVSGFCFAGLYVVAESWLNDRATNETRGKILSLYTIVTYLGVGAGQLLLNLDNPIGYPLFVLTSVLISIAVIPLLLSAGSPPEYKDSVNLKLVDLFRLSPFGVVGIFIEGFVAATFFALGPVYAQQIGLDLLNISYFMAAAVVGTIILQWPLGVLSDRFDRRGVITLVGAFAVLSAIACAMVSDLNTYLLFIAVALFGGLTLPLYSLCIAYTNDCLNPSQMVAASGSLVLINGLGSVLGPILVALVIDHYGMDYFFWCLGSVQVIMVVFALYRMTQRKPVTSSRHSTIQQAGYHPSSSTIESAHLYPEEKNTHDNEQ